MCKRRGILFFIKPLFILFLFSSTLFGQDRQGISQRSIQDFINPDGTFNRNSGFQGNLSVEEYNVHVGADGVPRFYTDSDGFQNARVMVAGDENWDDRFDQYGGANGPVYVITVHGNDVYFGGSFTMIGGIEANCIARWNGYQWFALDEGVQGEYHYEWVPEENMPYYESIGPFVNAITFYNDEIYVGGIFKVAGHDSAFCIAKWDGSEWSDIQGGVSGGYIRDYGFFPTCVNTISVYDGEIYIGGRFDKAGNVSCNGLAKWDGSQWISMSDQFEGSFYLTEINDMLINQNELVVAGDLFNWNRGIGHVARWDGTEWHSLNFPQSIWGGVAYGLAMKGTTLYLGGRFDPPGGPAVLYQWDGSEWMIIEVDSPMFVVNDIMVVDDEIIIGGGISEEEIHIAKWTGSEWSFFGSGVNGPVYTLASMNGAVFVGGDFTTAGLNPSYYIGLWNESGSPVFPQPPNPHVQTLFGDDFEDGDVEGWVMNDPSRWTVGEDGGSQVCYINTTDYSPGPNNRLGEYALIQNMDFGGFTFSCRARTRENLSSNGFADFCVVFNYQGENDYCYMIFNSGESETALYRILSGSRKLIETAPDFRIGDAQFHDIQMIRVENEVWVMVDEQVILYSDEITDSGQIGLGSYNDAASFDDVVIKTNESPTYPPFPIYDQILLYDNCNGDGSEYWIEKTGKRWRRFGTYELYDTNYKHGDNGRLGEYSVIRYYELEDFTFTCRAKSNEDFMINPYGDFCILFNFQDDDHYDYMMFNRAPYASKLYRITPAGRTEIGSASYNYRIEDNLFHDITLIRKDDQVWVKYDSEVILYADGVSGEGKAGVGSYNDAACFDDITVMVDSLDLFPHENHAPYANQDSVQIFQSGSIRIFVLSNDGDIDGDDLTVVSLDTTESLGDCVIELGDTTVAYTPLLGFTGEDSFEYVVGDGKGGVDTGLVVVNVMAINGQPVAIDDSVTIKQDSTVVIDILSNDSDPDGDVLTVVSIDTTESLGHCVIESGDTTVTYTPHLGFSGEDSFGYVVGDGRGGLDMGLVVINVLAINHLPVAVNDSVTIKQDSTVVIDVLKNDSDPDGDDLTVVSIDTTELLGCCVVELGDTIVTYAPQAGFSGRDSFGYVVGDGRGGLDTAQIVITVEPVTSLSDHQSLPTSFGLDQNFPNPFNPKTVINYQLPISSYVSLVVYNIKGEKVRTLVEEQKSAGVHSVIWDGRDQEGQVVSTGIYIYRMETKNFTETRKVTFLR